MRLNAVPVSSSFLRISLTAALLAGSSAASAQRSLEERVQALEARMAAVEGRTGSGAPAAAAATGPTCHRLSVNGYVLSPEARLTVTVNGTQVAAYEGSSASDNLEPFMRPGPNTIGLAFASPGAPNTSVELWCLVSPSAVSRNTIFTLKPRPGRLSGQTVVVLPGG